MWFRVDDSFYGHPKAAGMSNDSLATWTRAGDWSAWQLTDGRLPVALLEQFAGNAADPGSVARDLVDRRLWETTDEGYQFHDWADWNPTREQVLAKRKADADRRRRWLESRRDRSTGRAGNGVSHGVIDDVSHGVIDGVSHGVTDDLDHGVSHGVAHGVAHTSPTRPDPTRVGSVQVGDQANLRNAREDEDGSNDQPTEEYELDSLVQALMFAKTGRSVSRIEALSIRQTLLSGRNVRDRAAYLRSALSTRKDARAFLPTLEPSQPLPSSAVLRPRVDRSAAAGRGGAMARQLMAEKAAKDAANADARQAPEPPEPPEQEPLPADDDPGEPPGEDQYPF